MSVESMSTVPSSQMRLGAFTTGLIARNSSKWRKTETERCSNGTSISFMETAQRRT
jgi:hypothetical protein